jgi:tetratricopeptide (TPR) repeat protein
VKRAATTVIFTLLLSFAGAGARAQTTEDAVARARRLYESGAKHYYLGEFADALADFKEAYRAKDDPALLFNIGQCQYKLGDAAGALHSFRSYLHLAKNPTNGAEAEARVAELQAREGAAPGPALPPAAATISPPPSTSPPAEAAPGSRRRVLAYSLGGAGVVALGVGAYFGLRAFSKWHDSDAHCPADRCDDLGVMSAQQARTAAHVADITIGAGLVLAGVAAYLYMAPRGDSVARASVAGRVRIDPAVGPHEARVALGIAW